MGGGRGSRTTALCPLRYSPKSVPQRRYTCYASPALPDGRYRLDVSFSDGVLSAGKDAPIVRSFQSESQLFVQEGETVTAASAVDPQTGEVVEAEVTVERVP